MLYHGLGQGDVLSRQAGLVLKEELRELRLDLKAAEGYSAYIRTQTHLYDNTLPPTRPYLPIVPLSMDQAFVHMNLWGLSLFKPPFEI